MTITPTILAAAIISSLFAGAGLGILIVALLVASRTDDTSDQEHYQ